jgi:hypothetical protein
MFSTNPPARRADVAQRGYVLRHQPALPASVLPHSGSPRRASPQVPDVRRPATYAPQRVGPVHAAPLPHRRSGGRGKLGPKSRPALRTIWHGGHTRRQLSGCCVLDCRPASTVHLYSILSTKKGTTQDQKRQKMHLPCIPARSRDAQTGTIELRNATRTRPRRPGSRSNATRRHAAPPEFFIGAGREVLLAPFGARCRS